MHQVDAAVAAVDRALADDPPGATAHDVRRLGFHLRHRGYQIADVDALLDGLERRCVEAELRATPPWQLADRAVRALDALRNQVGTHEGARFRRVRPWRRGYDVAQVDALLARSLDDLETLRRGTAEMDAPRAGHLDPGEVRDTVFRRRRHGYREEPVDRAFDEVVDLLLRRDVLHDGLTGAPGAAGQDVSGRRPPAEGPSRSSG